MNAGFINQPQSNGNIMQPSFLLHVRRTNWIMWSSRFNYDNTGVMGRWNKRRVIVWVVWNKRQVSKSGVERSLARV